ncbi:anaphase-promoting complex component [Scheffersomyces coipomensis]|uniref:anaphase-promoting complex component n=1 Tax=Scheffersomyces coipomensis TaxID=1788519 RepID=UPI00315D3EA8
MVSNQKTPSQHNSTLFISPDINSRRQDLFITPPNPAAANSNTLFDSPASRRSSLFGHHQEGSTSNEPPHHNINNYNPNQNRILESEPLTAAEKLRLWRHDALNQHHYKTAEFIGNKVLALTDDPNDAFWLGQVYFNSGNYLRAKSLLTSKPEFEKSVSCRYLAAYCLIKLELWDDALDLVGETNPFRKDDNNNNNLSNQYEIKNSDGGVKLEASLCYLRGLIYSNQSNFEKAKECYKEAVLVDVKCFEAFEELIDNNLMTPSEEWDFINILNFRDLEDNDELIKLLYTTKLSKYLNIAKFDEAEQILREEYDLGNNSDILLSRADYLFVQCNFDECLSICEKILFQDEYNFSVMPNYLSTLHELGGRNKLFLKAHQLAENHPTNPMTWLAIGTYYLSINKIIEARKFFSKATLIDSNFGHAWVGFAHTFAAEGEHEQAISAYAFAARLFPGTHLPNLFLGMQHLQMNNLNLSEEYLLASYQICNTDPLLLNELGVINFHKSNFIKAELFFQEALGAAKYLNSDSKTWISIHANLGHVYRRGNQPYKALECFNQVIRISNKNDSNILSAMGLIYLKLGNAFKAIDILHDALAITPSDAVASDLLKRALEYNVTNSDYILSDNLITSHNPTLQYLSRTKWNKAKQDKENRIRHQEEIRERLKGGDNGNIYNTKLMTPLTQKTNHFLDKTDHDTSGHEGNIIEGDEAEEDVDDEIDIVAEGLRRGEDSSDEEEAVMEIESD